MFTGSFIARKLTNQERKSKLEKQKKRQRETILFMKGVMDEVTHLANYSTPVDPELVTFVVAKEDAYYPQSPHLPPMNEVWPSCDVSVTVPPIVLITTFDSCSSKSVSF